MQIIYKIISIAGLMLGYTADVIAQYGAPMNLYRHHFTGKIETEFCGEKAGRVKIDLFVRQGDRQINLQSFYSADNGTFDHNIFMEVEFDDSVFIQLTPLDLSRFKDTTFVFNSAMFRKMNKFEVPYSEMPPCKEEPLPKDLPILEDSIYADNQPISDSAALDGLTAIETQPIDLEKKLKLFPNPNQGEFTLEFEDKVEENYTVQIYDMAGKLIFNKKIQSEKGKNQVSFDTMKFAPGTYTLILMSSTKIAFVTYVQR